MTANGLSSEEKKEPDSNLDREKRGWEATRHPRAQRIVTWFAAACAALMGVADKEEFSGNASDIVNRVQAGVQHSRLYLNDPEVRTLIDKICGEDPKLNIEQCLNEYLRERGYQSYVQNATMESPPLFFVTIIPKEFTVGVGNPNPQPEIDSLENLCQSIVNATRDKEIMGLPQHRLSLGFNLHADSVKPGSSLMDIIRCVSSLETKQRNVRQLNVGNVPLTRDTDQPQTFPSLPFLELFTVHDPNFTDEHLKALCAAAPKLERLNIAYTGVQNVQSCASLKNLKMLYIHDTGISAANALKAVPSAINIHIDKEQSRKFKQTHPEFNGTLPTQLMEYRAG